MKDQIYFKMFEAEIETGIRKAIINGIDSYFGNTCGFFLQLKGRILLSLIFSLLYTECTQLLLTTCNHIFWSSEFLLTKKDKIRFRVPEQAHQVQL